MGDTKLAAVKGDPWKLHDLHDHPTEAKNLVFGNPGQAKEVERPWTGRLAEFCKLLSRDLKR